MIQPLMTSPYPMELLLLADPSEGKITRYVQDGAVYVTVEHEDVIGVYVLLQHDDETMELMNIAVADMYQRQGIGKQLLRHAIQTAKNARVKQLIVGTGNSSIEQLAFYQKNGFRMQNIIHDYFTNHYDGLIFEHRIQCRDRIELVIYF